MDRVKKSTDDVDAAFAALAHASAPMLDANMKTVLSQLDHLDNARLHAALASTVLTITCAYLRVGGEDITKNEELVGEMTTLRNIKTRIADVQKLVDRGSGKPASSLDVAAATRFIAAALNQRGDAATPAAGGAPSGPPSVAGSKRKAAAPPADAASGAGDGGAEAAAEPASAAASGAAQAKRRRDATATPQPDLKHSSWQTDYNKRFGKRA